MIIKTFKTAVMMALLATTGYQANAQAQEYVSPVKPAETGKAPGMKVKLLSTAGETKTYMLVFASGDEVVSGLTEFAQKYNVKSAHYKGLGDAVSAKAGFYDYAKKQFKVIKVDTSEITSFIGDVALFNGKPVAHTHFSGATSDGLVHGGHLLELIIGPTFEVTITTEPTPLYKKLNKEFEAGVIDPDLKQ
jgi:predicted DNA-binding protein with PD1-like motif